MAKLQKPKFVYMEGQLRSWEEAKLHVGCEAAIRGLNVFEGLKGYWQPDGNFAIVQLRRHFDRLRRSARLLQIPFNQTYEEFAKAVDLLVGALVEPGRDMWVRATLFVTEGHWGEDTVADLVLTAYHQDQRLPESINLGVSTWRRSADVALPARVKTGTNYQVARLARLEGRPLGCQDMVLLNPWGRVAEGTASCILVVREGVVLTPPATEGALESITVDIIEQLALSAGIRFERRPIDRTELLVADEIGLCGTLHELPVATSIEQLPLSKEAPILRALQARYLDAVRGVNPHPAVELFILPSCGTRKSAGDHSTASSAEPSRPTGFIR